MKKIIPITPSTGGAVSPGDIIGRDDEIKLFWSKLEKQGIALFAERRLGKSSIIRKMEADGKDGFIPIYKPIEGVSSPEVLASVLLDRVKELNLIDESLSKRCETFYNSATEVVEEIKGIKLKKLEYSWQKQLHYLLSKLTKKHIDKKIVIMLDEFSIFLDKLDKQMAATVIGFLRDITFEEEFKNVRFVYCGSIGIDLVLNKIKDGGHNIGDPINHMFKHTLQPFTEENANYFGKCLNLGCNLNLSGKLITQICNRANYIPYFIDIVFDRIPKKKRCNKEIIDNIFEGILNDTKGKQSIRHFYDRIKDFYPNYKMSVHILNFVSLSSQEVSETEIASNVLSIIEGMDRIEINEEIDRLKNDGYLLCNSNNGNRNYDFKYSLLKLWWKRNKAY